MSDCCRGKFSITRQLDTGGNVIDSKDADFAAPFPTGSIGENDVTAQSFHRSVMSRMIDNFLQAFHYFHTSNIRPKDNLSSIYFASQNCPRFPHVFSKRANGQNKNRSVEQSDVWRSSELYKTVPSTGLTLLARNPQISQSGRIVSLRNFW